MTSSIASRRLIIGWNEYVALPEWGVRRLRAKIDTGARSSALHVDDLETRPGDRVSFAIVLSRRHPRRVRVTAPISRIGRVRSSTGHGGTRYFVRTMVRLGPIERAVEMNLVDREGMIFRMLLGRTALAGVLVDASRGRLLGRPPRGA
jgi:hypothetical protein